MLIIKFGEAFLKSKLTKKKFISLLIKNLKSKGINKINVKNAYLEIEEDISPFVLTNVFGIYKVEKVDVFEYPKSSSVELILNKIFEKIKLKIHKIGFIPKTFRVSVVREDKSFALNSLEIQKEIGKLVEKNFNITANYKEFELEIKIRILKDKFWLWTDFDEFKGIGGLPYGIEGKALTLFSGGIDSPVATFLVAKRGVSQDFLFLNIPGSDLLLQQVFAVYKYLYNTYGIKGKFYELKINNYIEIIKKEIPEGIRQIIFKTFLYDVSGLVADYLNLSVIVNGENIGQVSTQTLTNMIFLNKITDKLVLRPVLAYDKIEIINLAKKIGTYSLSIKIKETCSLEKHSNSKVKNIDKIMEYYSKINFDKKNILKNLVQIEEPLKFDFNKLAISDVKGEVIDLEKNNNFNLVKDKTYTFKCSSGYKASQKAYIYYQKGFNVWWLK